MYKGGFLRSRWIIVAAWLAVGVALALGGAGGCTLISLGTLGTLAGIAGSAASTGREVYGMGKLDSAEQQTPDAVVLATRAAARELGLEQEPAPEFRAMDQPRVGQMNYRDDRGDQIRVRIERRAARLVLLRVDVGIFGSEPIAHLVLNRIRAHLLQTGAADSRPAPSDRHDAVNDASSPSARESPA